MLKIYTLHQLFYCAKNDRQHSPSFRASENCVLLRACVNPLLVTSALLYVHKLNTFSECFVLIVVLIHTMLWHQTLMSKWLIADDGAAYARALLPPFLGLYGAHRIKCVSRLV